jgi:predicted nucleic acid-binding protein
VVIADRFLFDTNVLISALNGERQSALAALEAASSPRGAISIITWMEVMVGARPADAQRTSLFLARLQNVEISREIAERAVAVRRQMRLKLPDAIVYATALSTGRTLVTFNTRDFPAGTPAVRKPDAA